MNLDRNENKEKGESFLQSKQFMAGRDRSQLEFSKTVGSFSVSINKTINALSGQIKILNERLISLTGTKKKESVDENKNKTIGSFSLSISKTIKDLSGRIEKLNEKIIDLTSTKKKERDSTIRKDDPNKKLYKAVDDLEPLMRESVKIQKQNQKEKAGGILGFLKNIATFAAISGIVGYLLFGQDKYVTQVREMFKKVGGFIWDGFKDVANLAWTNIKEWWDIDGKEFTKKTMTTISNGLIDGIGKVWEWAKENPKTAIMGGLLGFLLTGNLGTLATLSVGFGKFAIGALKLMLMNPQATLIIASAAATAIAINKAKEMGKIADEVKKSREERDLIEKEKVTEKIKYQKMKREDALHLTKNFEIQQKLQKDLYKTPSGKQLKWGMTGVKEFLKPGSAWEPSFKEAEKMGLFQRQDIQSQFAPSGKWTKEAKQRAVEYEIRRMSFARGLDFKRANEQFGETYIMPEARISSNDLNPYPGIRLNDQTVDIENLQSPLLKSLKDMGEEYFNKTEGDSITVTSGFRTHEKQHELYDKYQKGEMPYIVAEPGKSPHEKGMSVDINSSDVEKLKGLGILNKFGFKQPMPQKDPVHLAYSSKPSTEQGDPVLNLPKSSIENKKDLTMSSKLDLSDSTIKALAQAIGVSFKGALPTPRANQVNIDVGMRG